MNYIIPATKARKQFFKLLSLADEPGKSYTITVDGAPKVVMMSVEDFEGWQETLEILSDKALMQGIQQGLNEMKMGKLYTEEEVKKIIQF